MLNYHQVVTFNGDLTGFAKRFMVILYEQEAKLSV